MKVAELSYLLCKVLRRDPVGRLKLYQSFAKILAPSPESALESLKARKMFLVSSTGRTGTTWLANLLNRARDYYVDHEPLPAEQYFHMLAMENPQLATDYVNNFRISDIAWRLKPYPNHNYGEVNGALRRHIIPLRNALPHLKVIHIIRNPRDVIVSMLNRSAFSSSDKIYSQLKCPSELNPNQWNEMDRFERLCWMWQSENAHLRTHSDSCAVFEQITSSYEHLDRQILKPLEIELNEQLWQEQGKNGKNASRTREASHSNWTAEQERTFERLCGSELSHYPWYTQS